MEIMSSTRRIRIVCVSDTHNDDLTGHVPDGDVFVHAGDMTDDGTPKELEKALGWIRSLPHKLKVVIAGTILSCQPGGIYQGPG
jgi:predicted phosphodiesterase